MIVQTTKRLFILLFFCLIAAGIWQPQIVSAAPWEQNNNGSCVIPPSGPWPACARNQTQPPTTTSNNNSNNNGDCVIPPSGPWPACARNQTSSNNNNNNGSNGSCVIPPSGPWPACARNQTSSNNNGNNSNNGSNGSCVIPPSGPWPACARNQTSNNNNNNGWTPPVTENSEPRVNTFRIEPANPQPGTTVKVIWDVDNVSNVAINIGHPMMMNTADKINIWFDNLPAKGWQMIDLPESGCMRELPIRLLTNQSGMRELDEIRVSYPTRQWGFNAAAFGLENTCPTSEFLFGRLSEQRFEHGWMIWSEARDMIFVMFDAEQPNWSNQVWWRDDGFDPAVHPVSDPSIIAPDGLRQPTYGFGKVWREESAIRQRLGWAVDAEVNYTGHIQGYAHGSRLSSRSGTMISGGDGFVWKFSAGMGPTSWEKTTVWNP